MKQIVLNIWKDDRGQDLIEYALDGGFRCGSSRRNYARRFSQYQPDLLEGLVCYDSSQPVVAYPDDYRNRKGREALSGFRILRESPDVRFGFRQFNAPRRAQRSTAGPAGRPENQTATPFHPRSPDSDSLRFACRRFAVSAIDPSSSEFLIHPIVTSVIFSFPTVGAIFSRHSPICREMNRRTNGGRCRCR